MEKTELKIKVNYRFTTISPGIYTF